MLLLMMLDKTKFWLLSVLEVNDRLRVDDRLCVLHKLVHLKRLRMNKLVSLAVVSVNRRMPHLSKEILWFYFP